MTAPTWVLYKPDPTDPLFIEPTGIEGEWTLESDPADVAREIITEQAGGHPDWIAELYGPDGRLIAWAEWRDGKAVAHLMRARKPHTCTDCGAGYDQAAGEWRQPGTRGEGG